MWKNCLNLVKIHNFFSALLKNEIFKRSWKIERNGEKKESERERESVGKKATKIEVRWEEIIKIRIFFFFLITKGIL